MIKKIALGALVVGSLNLAFVAPAEAQTGRLCGFASVTDPTVEDGDTQTGQLSGGPVFSADPDNPGEESATITLTCTIQVGAANTTHSGTDAASATSAPGTGVAVLPATLVSYVSPEGQPVTLCTQVSVNGVDRFWDGENSVWTTNPGVACSAAIQQEIFPGPLGPVLDAIDEIIIDTVDPALCAQLASLSPGVPGVVDIDSTGDTYVLGEFFWDCPPYAA